ncbi:putative uncharacterized protein encoded by LINC00303 [Symphalangus syndactylus]|uniref:putative uncharacterized protein encoded by LINC00303 n=1 Tax=Symphalangus syndactylus TaxID=9590 RepID=UPI002442348A|nr:putative uncharacterized protein encoded by LINC00303 [Symphalangus syndactylus]
MYKSWTLGDPKEKEGVGNILEETKRTQNDTEQASRAIDSPLQSPQTDSMKALAIGFHWFLPQIHTLPPITKATRHRWPPACCGRRAGQTTLPPLTPIARACESMKRRCPGNYLMQREGKVMQRHPTLR